VITATPAFGKMLVRRGIPAEKITVVMNAADPRYFALDENMPRARQTDESFTLLYVGTVARRYGLDVCIRALPILRDEIRGIKLKVVPKIRHEGKALDDCLELARILDVSDLVEVTDPVPLEMMPEMMRQADIGIYPALKDCHMDVALSLKIPEMANVGLCIVATRLSVLEELYGETCIAFVPSGDHVAFAAKVLELYRSPELRQCLSRNALERSASFTWDSQYRVYRELLESMLGR
jgi:glycosyltransferase involved in cell wall biosynthesis